MKFARLIAILMVLLNNTKTTAKLLSEKFEVSVRTIYRDLDTLLIAGIPVMTQQGVNGGVYLDENFKIDKSYFSLNEITHLLIGLKGIETALNDTDLKLTLEKIKQLVPETINNEIENSFSQISIDLFTWQGHKEIKEKIKLARLAMTESKTLRFAYIDNKNRLSHRHVEPYRLLYKESSWYLEAFCLMRVDFRMFKFSKITDLKLTDLPYKKRVFTPQDQSKHGWIKDYILYIEIEFNAAILEDMVLVCGEKNITPLSQTRFKATMPFTDDVYSYNKLLSYGHDIMCTGPDHIIKNLMSHMDDLKNHYKKKNLDSV